MKVAPLTDLKIYLIQVHITRHWTSDSSLVSFACGPKRQHSASFHCELLFMTQKPQWPWPSKLGGAQEAFFLISWRPLGDLWKSGGHFEVVIEVILEVILRWISCRREMLDSSWELVSSKVCWMSRALRKHRPGLSLTCLNWRGTLIWTPAVCEP